MKQTYSVETLAKLLQNSPSCFHAISNIRSILIENGFTQLSEKEKWNLKSGKNYFVTRNSSSLIAFSIPESGIHSYRVMASHSDSPCFKIKENPEIKVDNHYTKLNVEKYGGAILSPWLDRPLSVAGRIFLDTEDDIQEKLVCINKDLVLIPNLAIHMNREVNDGYKYNVQNDLLPLFSDADSEKTFMDILAEAADIDSSQILGHDLFLYNRQQPSLWGASDEYVSAPRLDDLECAYGSLIGFLSGKKEKHTAIYCVFDNEEVGSSTKQGAASTFLADTLTRICIAMNLSQEDYMIQLANSFMLSADNAHAVHPNNPGKSDPVNRPYLNNGVVLKFNGNQQYCTDGASAAFVRKLCKTNNIPLQVFTNRSDMPGGATLGNIASTKVPLPAADIGLPQLAMHSPYETAGVKDWEAYVKLSEVFYE